MSNRFVSLLFRSFLTWILHTILASLPTAALLTQTYLHYFLHNPGLLGSLYYHYQMDVVVVLVQCGELCLLKEDRFF